MTCHIDHSEREKHPATMDNLLRMIADFETTLNAKEQIGTVQRRYAIDTLADARRDLESCRTPNVVMHVAAIAPEPEAWTHSPLIQWINTLSVDLKLMEQGMKPDASGMVVAITQERLDQGKRLAMELSSCREISKFY